MRLVYIVRRFPTVSETFILREIQELIRQGDEVTLCSLRRPTDEPRHPGADELVRRAVYVPRPHRSPALALAVLSTLVNAPGLAWPALWWSARQALRAREPAIFQAFAEAAYLRSRIPSDADQIHAHYADAPTRVAQLLGRLTGLPFSFTGHAYDIFERVPRDLADRIAAARFVVAVSDDSREHLAGLAAPADGSRIVVVHNGIDRGLFPAREREPSGPARILTVSRLVEKKGLETAVEACARLASRGVDFDWEIVGEGPLRSQLERHARELDVWERITFLGQRGYEEVWPAYERATVFALPCRRSPTGDQDALPVSLTEAMAVGVPVVTTAVGGIPELVDDRRSGLVVPPEDPDALADAIERLLTDPGLRRDLVAGGHAAIADFEIEDCVASLRGLFASGPGAAASRRSQLV